MGVSKDNKKDYLKYVFQRKGGRSIIDKKPVLSPDGESVLIIVENIVRVYSIQTGDCVRILEPETSLPHVLSDNIISIYFPENEQHNLYGCSENGLFTIWTWEKGAVLREKELQIPDDVKILTFHLIDNNECFITGISSHKDNLFYATYSLKTGEQLYDYSVGSCIIYSGIIDVAIGTCNNDRFALICNGTKGVFVQNLIQPHIRSIIFNQNQIRVLSVATHASENCVAFTDALGRATVARGNVYKPGVLSFEVLHWHSLPLISCVFSIQGSYLLTGGLEAVLVKWTIGSLVNKANEKKFIPRLPGFIRFIAVSKSHIAITLTNNAVIIANTQLRVISTILECGGLSPAARTLGSTLVYCRRLRALLLGGRPGHLQLYSTTSASVLYNIDITQQNMIPPTRSNLLPLNTEVNCAAMSADGSCLVTSEYRNDGKMYTEEKLKFWIASNDKATPFLLNTCVNLSHGGCNVVSIAIDTAGTRCVTAGGDHKFRIWKKENPKKSLNKRISWSCLTACYYSSGIGKTMAHDNLNKLKITDYHYDITLEFPYMTDNKEPDIVKQLININKVNDLVKTEDIKNDSLNDSSNDMGGVAISQDGSLIAAWFGCKLTLWDSHLCTLRTTLSHMALRPKGISVQFGNCDASHYLACTTRDCLAVWSLLSLSVKWMVQLQSSCLTSDPFSNKMAVVTTSNDVFVFSPHSSKPILEKDCLLQPSTGVIKYCTFGASNKKTETKLYMMRNDSELYCFQPEKSEQGELEIISQKNLPTSKFSQLVAEQRFSGIQAPSTNKHGNRNADVFGKTAISQFFSAAPHMMPSVSLLCSSFLEQLSGHHEPKPMEAEPLEDMEVDQLSSDEEDDLPPRIPTPTKPELWTANYEEVKEKRLRKIMKQPMVFDVSMDLFAN